MLIAVAASPTVAIPTLISLRDGDHELIRIISQPDRPAGRGKSLLPTPVSQWARDNGVELVRPQTSSELLESVKDVDLVITIGYGKLIPEEILSIPRHGFINLHFSILPRWRGAAPVQRAIEAGDSLTGVTVFRLDKGMDTGPIFTIHRFALDSDISADELFEELGALGVGAVLETLEKIEGGVRPTPQISEGATRAEKLTREEGLIDWRQPAEKVSAKIRAFTAKPGAWTNFRGTPIKVSRPTISSDILPPGELRLKEKRVLIGTGSFALEIGSISAPGKQLMDALSWANGVRIQSGERCE